MTTITSPLDLASRLSYQLEIRRPTLDRMDRYVSGTQPLAYLAPEVQAATQGRLQNLSVNWPRLCISAIEERLDVSGFRVGDSETPATDLWRLWQSNCLDEGSQLAHFESLVYGTSYALVWAGPDGAPSITVESPFECFVWRHPSTRVREYGLKRWLGDDDYGHATLFTQTAVHIFRSPSRYTDPLTLGSDPFSSANYPLIADPTLAGWVEVDRLDNPLGVVPLVPIPNRPRVRRPDGESEIAELCPLYDAIDKISTDLMVSSEFHAMPRRWATGIQLPEVIGDDGVPTGEVDTSAAFSATPGRVWLAEAPDARLGEFSASDLNGFVNALQELTRTLAALAALPPHYMNTPAQQPASADAIRSSESSLVTRCRRKMQVLSGCWEEVMRLASAIDTGSFDPALTQLETVWSSPETRTTAEAADAALKVTSGGLLANDFALDYYLDMSPSEIEMNRQLRRAQALDTAALAHLAGPPPTPPPVQP